MVTDRKEGARPWPHHSQRLGIHCCQTLIQHEVILDTDGARAYKLKLSGVIHDNVVHKKECVIIKGKATRSTNTNYLMENM